MLKSIYMQSFTANVLNSIELKTFKFSASVAKTYIARSFQPLAKILLPSRRHSLIMQTYWVNNCLQLLLNHFYL